MKEEYDFMYEKYATFLRVEALSNHLGDFRLKKSLEHLEEVRQTLSAEIHGAVLEACGLRPDGYKIGQLRYDIRKMKAHGLLERVGTQYRHRLTDKGTRVCLMFTLFHKRVCGPLGDSLFNRAPNPGFKPATKLEVAYRRADRSVDKFYGCWPPDGPIRGKSDRQPSGERIVTHRTAVSETRIPEPNPDSTRKSVRKPGLNPEVEVRPPAASLSESPRAARSRPPATL